MSSKIGKGVKWLCIVVGAFTVFHFLFDSLYPFVDNDFKQQQIEDQYNHLMGKAYNLGMLWGKEAAGEYESQILDFYVPIDSRSTARKVALKLLNERIVDGACWGPNDCGDLPTKDELLKWYKMKDRKVGKMPVMAFESGYVDAFTRYFEN